MHLPAFEALLTDAGAELLADVDPEAAAADRLAAASRLRGDPRLAALDPALPVSDLVNAALNQVLLRRRGRAKFGDRAERMYFTPDGLEQSTRHVVAAYRAERTAAVADAVLDGAAAGDLCCGVGADLLALAERGVPVEGVDADPLTVAVARANVAALGLEHLARVREGDAAGIAPGAYPLLFCDPARRGGRGRVFDPAAYSPPWDVAVRLAEGSGAACLKAAPGLPHEAIPPSASAEWISVDGELKETVLWFGAAARGPRRRATVLSERKGAAQGGPGRGPVPEDGARPGAQGPPPADVGWQLVEEPGLGAAPVAPARRYLYDPDPAVVRSHLVAEAAARVDGALLDERIAYFTADRAVLSPLWRVLEVTEVMPFSLKRLRSALRARGAGTVTVMKRGSAVDTEKLRRDLRASGPESVTVVLTRIGERPVSLLCREIAGTGGL
ncbi:SAM-dependent methyltransferase [Nocardiopsis sp. NRRL B-16309]|uniref:class I SAM-dependent methyltransferase n=1 Tax=Nocardiopsis sp. NRRL B-16309 TaxID=1519494 RepID=UPI0006AFFD14|nr:SAM-dependent methyltransferase [Nocardiopsis sp. NRRL B-16309]KOX20771.1 methyltransferase [Nocardiopsis sp. NRRL B-16309]